MNDTYIVRLEDNTIGTIDGDALDGRGIEDLVGKSVRARLQDENGVPIEVTGVVVEVLE